MTASRLPVARWALVSKKRYKDNTTALFEAVILLGSGSSGLPLVNIG